MPPQRIGSPILSGGVFCLRERCFQKRLLYLKNNIPVTMSSKENFINFTISFLAIFLGMLCTFVGQGIIDRAADRNEVRSALELVRSELAANVEDIETMADYIDQEQRSAKYFLANSTTLDKCPLDSVNYHSGMLLAEASMTLPHNALELLKMSSLFQKLGNDQLSMDIIRAYDSCEYSVAVYNKYISERDEKFNQTLNEKSIAQFASSGFIDIKKFIKTTSGLYTIRWITSQVTPDKEQFINDVEAAIASIDGYLAADRHSRKKSRKE